MAIVFSITTPNNLVVLDANRKGSIVFSVTNITTQPQAGQIVVRPARAETAGWFTVKDPNREFPLGRSTEVSVQIAVPKDAPQQQKVEFELDVVREGSEPLEERTDLGPKASFDVPAYKRPFVWWPFAVAGGVLVLIVAVVVYFLTRPINVPANLESMDPTQAARALSAAGLQVGDVYSAPNDEIGEGLLAFSTPAARTPVPRGGKVDLVFSSGKALVNVPSLAGQSAEQAKAALAAAGLTFGSSVEAFDPAVPAGAVVSSDPASGQPLPPGGPVTLVISKGPTPNTPTPAPIVKSLDRAPSEDTFAYPSTYICFQIKPWVVPHQLLPLLPFEKNSFQELPALSTAVVSPKIKFTLVAPVFTLEPKPVKCADSKSPELVLENVLSGDQFFPGAAVMRFDFNGDVPDGATLTAASLKLSVASFASGTSSMSVYISAATNAWAVGGTSPVCSGDHSATVTMNQPGAYVIDLAPLLAANATNILKNGLCVQSNSVGLVNLVSSEGGIATQRPLLSITYQK